jgi:hypothetical protein
MDTVHVSVIWRIVAIVIGRAAILDHHYHNNDEHDNDDDDDDDDNGNGNGNDSNMM